MSCNKCDHARTCEILGQCIHLHELVQGDDVFKKRLKTIPYKNRLRFVLRHMKNKKPYKVSEEKSWSSRLQDIREKFECHRPNNKLL
jgi:uncharacterized protein (DUF1919 family)